MPEEIIFQKITSHSTMTSVCTTETVTFKVTDDIYKIAERWKKLCLENMYTWRSMDQDIIEEARKMIVIR